MSRAPIPQQPAVRRPGLPDFEIVRAMVREYAAAIAIDLSFQKFEDELNSLPGPYAEPEGVILIAEFANSPVGVVALKPLSAEICEMKRLYVKPSARGSGVGVVLIDALIEHARRHCYCRMVLDTLPQMTAAIRLYESRGFAHCAPYYSNPNPALFYALDLQ